MEVKKELLEETLENLEKEIWPNINPEDESHLVRTCNRLRKIQLKDFEIEDLRIMIGQNIGLKFLMPLAIMKLNEDILVEGDFYPGDLLMTVLRSDKDFWESEPTFWNEMLNILDLQSDRIKDEETSFEMKVDWYEKIKRFRSLLS